MVNEILEVKEWLNGININEKCLYRTCFMLAKWYKQQELSHIEIRKKIFEWGKKYNIYIKCNVNKIIYQAIEDKHRLRGDESIVKVSLNDIEEITMRFDSVPCKKIALALLCYAKTSADINNEFTISSLALSNWIGINSGNLSGIYLKELQDFGYIQKVDDSKKYAWDNENKAVLKSLRLKILVPIENNGTYILENNNIQKLYSDIFDKPDDNI